MPVARGPPPVTSAVPPGSESDGSEVWSLVYCIPPVAICASADVGWLATYQSRSDWCMPSTEISRTCWIGLAEVDACGWDAAAGPAPSPMGIARAAAAAASDATRVRVFICASLGSTTPHTWDGR